MDTEKPQKIILLASSIVSRDLRRQSSRQGRLLHFVTPREGDKRRSRAAEPQPIEGPRFRPVNQHLWSKPMIDLERLEKQLLHLRSRQAFHVERLFEMYNSALQTQRTINTLHHQVVTELSRLHENQPEL